MFQFWCQWKVTQWQVYSCRGKISAYNIFFQVIYVIVTPCLWGIYRKYTKRYLIILRVKPEGLPNITKCNSDKSRGTGNGLTSLYPFSELVGTSIYMMTFSELLSNSDSSLAIMTSNSSKSVFETDKIVQDYQVWKHREWVQRRTKTTTFNCPRNRS